jgi:hypothetical protein
MIEWLVTAPRRREEYGEVLANLCLADVFRKSLRAKLRLDGKIVV